MLSFKLNQILIPQEIYANVLCRADRYWSRAATEVKQQATTSLILAGGIPVKI
jgi:hypothetical protein